jgi:serine/threonine protein kinase
VYALGATLYEALTGAPPLNARTWPALAEAYRHDPTVPPLDVEGLPPEVVDVCTRCLARDPAARPGSAELARQLSAAVTGTPARVAAPEAPQRVSAIAQTTVDAARTAPPWYRRAWPGFAVGAVVVVFLAFLLLHRDRAPAPSAVAPTPPSPSPSPAAAPPSPALSQAPTPAPATRAPRPSAPTSASVTTVALRTLDTLLSQTEDGQRGGQIRPDAAIDLENILHNLQRAVWSGQTVDYAQQARELRDKITARIQDRGIDEGYASRMLSTVDTLAAL